MSTLHKIVCTCFLWPWLGLVWRQCNSLYTSGFVDDVTFAHNRPGKGDASRAYTQSDSPGGRTGGKVWCLRLSSFVNFVEV